MPRTNTVNNVLFITNQPATFPFRHEICLYKKRKKQVMKRTALLFALAVAAPSVSQATSATEDEGHLYKPNITIEPSTQFSQRYFEKGRVTVSQHYLAFFITNRLNNLQLFN